MDPSSIYFDTNTGFLLLGTSAAPSVTPARGAARGKGKGGKGKGKGKGGKGRRGACLGFETDHTCPWEAQIAPWLPSLQLTSAPPRKCLGCILLRRAVNGRPSLAEDEAEWQRQCANLHAQGIQVIQPLECLERLANGQALSDKDAQLRGLPPYVPPHPPAAATAGQGPPAPGRGGVPPSYGPTGGAAPTPPPPTPAAEAAQGMPAQVPPGMPPPRHPTAAAQQTAGPAATTVATRVAAALAKHDRSTGARGRLITGARAAGAAQTTAAAHAAAAALGAAPPPAATTGGPGPGPPPEAATGTATPEVLALRHALSDAAESLGGRGLPQAPAAAQCPSPSAAPTPTAKHASEDVPDADPAIAIEALRAELAAAKEAAAKAEAEQARSTAAAVRTAVAEAMRADSLMRAATDLRVQRDHASSKARHLAVAASLDDRHASASREAGLAARALQAAVSESTRTAAPTKEAPPATAAQEVEQTAQAQAAATDAGRGFSTPTAREDEPEAVIGTAPDAQPADGGAPRTSKRLKQTQASV